MKKLTVNGKERICVERGAGPQNLARRRGRPGEPIITVEDAAQELVLLRLEGRPIKKSVSNMLWYMRRADSRRANRATKASTRLPSRRYDGPLDTVLVKDYIGLLHCPTQRYSL
jgi:hypothetical protein